MTMRRAQPALAALLMLCAAGFIAGTMLMAKVIGTGALGPPLPALQVSHGRFLVASAIFGSAALVLRPRIIAPRWRLHLGRSLFGWMGVSCMFAAVAFLPLSDATAISFLNPVFAMLLAIPFLGEKVGPWRWVAAALALTGAMILLRPGPETFQLAGLVALAAAGLLGAEVIFIKRLANAEGAFQILLINNAFGLAFSSLAVVPVWVPPSGAQWLALAGLGAMMAAAQTCFVHAMARADASFVTPFTYLTLVFAALYDLLIFDVVPDGVSLTGALVILTGVALLVWRERRAQALSR